MPKIRVKTWAALILVVACSRPASAAAGEHWVTTWATAQPLAPASSMFGPGRSGPGAPGPQPAAPAPAMPGPPPGGRGGAGRGPGGGRGPAPLPTSFTDQTVRMILRTSIGGRKVRVELSNM